MVPGYRNDCTDEPTTSTVCVCMCACVCVFVCVCLRQALAAWSRLASLWQSSSLCLWSTGTAEPAPVFTVDRTASLPYHSSTAGGSILKGGKQRQEVLGVCPVSPRQEMAELDSEFWFLVSLGSGLNTAVQLEDLELDLP